MPQLRKKYRVWVKFYCWSLSHFSSIHGSESRSSALRTHQNRFWPGLCPGPRWGSSQRSPDSLVSWGYPLPIPHLLSALGASILRPYRHFFLSTSSPANMLKQFVPTFWRVRIRSRVSNIEKNRILFIGAFCGSVLSKWFSLVSFMIFSASSDILTAMNDNS